MRRIVRSTALVAGAAMSLSGCWVQVGFDRGHTRYNDLEGQLTAANVATLGEEWSVDLGTPLTEPIVRDGKVFVGTGGKADDGRLTAGAAALAVDDGSTVWTRTQADHVGGDSSSFAITAPVTFVGDELWTSRTVLAFLLTTILYSSTAAPERLDPDDGSIIGWEEGFGGIASVDAGDRVIVTTRSASTRMQVLDGATLAPLWETGVTSAPNPTMPVEPPAVAGDRIFVAGSLIEAYPLDCVNQCAPTWSVNLGAAPGPFAVPATGPSLFTVVGNEVVALDKATGAVAWRGALGAGSPGIAVAQDAVYVGAGTDLFAFAAGGCGEASCIPAATAPLASAATSSLAVAGGVVYVGESGGVEAFATGSLDPLADVDVIGTAERLSVADGRLFVVSRPGTRPTRLTVFAPMP